MQVKLSDIGWQAPALPTPTVSGDAGSKLSWLMAYCLGVAAFSAFLLLHEPALPTEHAAAFLGERSQRRWGIRSPASRAVWWRLRQVATKAWERH